MNFSNQDFRRVDKDRARADEMDAQRGARPSPSKQGFLKKTRGPQPRNWISYGLPPEYPTSHRKAQSCVTQMHEPHRHPQHPNWRSPQGRISITIGKIAVERRLDKAQQCHPGGTQVIGTWTRKLHYGEVNEHPYSPVPRSGLRAGPRPWKDYSLRSASGRPADRGAANRPSG